MATFVAVAHLQWGKSEEGVRGDNLEGGGDGGRDDGKEGGSGGDRAGGIVLVGVAVAHGVVHLMSVGHATCSSGGLG